MAPFQWLKNMNWQPVIHITEETHVALVRRRFRFSGLVQGVGFRYEAQRIASQLDLVGWVKNQ